MEDSKFYPIYTSGGEIGKLYPEVPRTDKVIVLDIDQTLVCTYDDEKLFETLEVMTDNSLLDIRTRAYLITLFDLGGKKGEGKELRLWGVFRPHMKSFIKFCFDYFKHVIIWSAGEYDYVHGICKKIFHGGKYPHMIFTKNDCETNRTRYVKPLSKVAQAIGCDMSKIIILDDRVYTFGPNPSNGILIPGYCPEDWGSKGKENAVNALRISDQRLLEFVHWLMRPEVVSGTDVRNLDKSVFK
jgi:hypothetical protein